MDLEVIKKTVFKEPDKVKVLFEKGGERGSAEKLARTLGVEFTESPDSVKNADIILRYNKEGLFFESEGQALHGDFSKLRQRLEKGRVDHELLVKAAKFKGEKPEDLAVIDATAGLGEDSVLLAFAGFKVTLYERDPIICALLKDTVRRALKVQWLSDAAKRMTVIEGDSIAELPKLLDPPDMILLDPMFPAKKNSGLVKKKFQMIYLLERQSSDESDLMQAALAAHPRKIVVKRPADGPFLGDLKPGYSLSGKTIRYDCIVL
ncbi:MAG: class I SAM-dependent methyltransferase [Lachnospiraceae bacterium]|nr:class I SAM-dependent methyltransferase [Lachnospiraceae bacterium]